jgi:DNA-directed RNA polymerase
MFKNFTPTFPELIMPTAIEVVEANRSITTAIVNLVPHTQTKDAMAKVTSAALSTATLFAEQLDKMTKTFKDFAEKKKV